MINFDFKTISIVEVLNKYPEKGEKIEIIYQIATNFDLAPTKLTINDKQQYDLIPTDEKGVYKVSYQVPDVAGQVDIEVNKIHFENEQVITLDEPYENKIDVLKTKPTVNISSVDLLELETVVFTIDITDDDNAMTKGVANVHNENQELKKGSNQMTVKIPTDTEHTLKVDIDYDLDSNQLEADSESGNDNVSKLTEQRLFTLTSDYGLEISNLRAVKKDTNETVKYVTKGEQIQLRFNCVNVTDIKPQYLFLNDIQNEENDGIMYEINSVSGKENEYYVNVTANSTAGTQQFEIKSIQLSSGKTIRKEQFKGDKEQTSEVIVLKTKPTIDSYVSSNIENSVTTTFNITDEDGALNNSRIKLIKEDTNKEIDSRVIHSGSNSYTFEELETEVKYKIIVENRYRLSEDGQNDKTEIFNEDHIEIARKNESNFKVKNLRISERVPINNKAQLTFENSLMSYEDVDKINIDDTE